MNLHELETSYKIKTVEHNEVKDKIKNRQHLASREQILIWRRQKRNLWNALKEIMCKIELLQK